MMTLTVLVLVIMACLAYQVCKMVYPKEKIVPLMLIWLCLTLLLLLVDWIYTLYTFTHPEWSCGNSRNSECMGSVFTGLPSFALSIAVVLNLNKWIYFKLRINAFIKVGFGLSATIL